MTVRAALDGQTGRRRGSRSSRGPTRSWDFAEDIVPIFTRLGCNTGACHGKADGQNGFHLSLFGYDRAGDFQALARDGGQRRLSRLVPEESLFLAKATGTVPHGGGRRLTVGSPEYQTLLAWVRDGAPERRGKSHGAGRAGVSVEPGAVPFGEPGPRQLRVMAHYDDGHQRDVTRLASYRVNDDSAASVTPQGRVDAASPRRDRPDRALSVVCRQLAAVDGHQSRACASTFPSSSGETSSTTSCSSGSSRSRCPRARRPATPRSCAASRSI